MARKCHLSLLCKDRGRAPERHRHLVKDAEYWNTRVCSSSKMSPVLSRELPRRHLTDWKVPAWRQEINLVPGAEFMAAGTLSVGMATSASQKSWGVMCVMLWLLLVSVIQALLAASLFSCPPPALALLQADHTWAWGGRSVFQRYRQLCKARTFLGPVLHLGCDRICGGTSSPQCPCRAWQCPSGCCSLSREFSRTWPGSTDIPTAAGRWTLSLE